MKRKPQCGHESSNAAACAEGRAGKDPQENPIRDSTGTLSDMKRTDSSSSFGDSELPPIPEEWTNAKPQQSVCKLHHGPNFASTLSNGGSACTHINYAWCCELGITRSPGVIGCLSNTLSNTAEEELVISTEHYPSSVHKSNRAFLDRSDLIRGCGIDWNAGPVMHAPLAVEFRGQPGLWREVSMESTADCASMDDI